MTEFPPDDLASRVRRLPPAQRAQAMAYVRALEHATKGPDLARFAGTIPASDLSEIAAVIEADCERVDASEW